MVLKAFQKFHPITPDIKNGLEWLPLRSSHIQRNNYFKFRVCRALRSAPNAIFTGGVVTANGICSAAFCESAALGAGARSPLGELSRSD